MIIDLQRRIAEAGRIRLGAQVGEGERSHPTRLETFRFTSPDRRRLEAVARRYGGEVRPWQAPAGSQWEVISQTTELEVIVPPAELAFSQWYELWSAAGCKRRCDGVTEQISDGPCLCDPAARECDIHTRLSVLLRDIPGLGVWRLETQGWYAATELSGAVEVLRAIAGETGRLIPARLRLEERQVVRPDKSGRPTTRRFVVPVLDVDVPLDRLLAAVATDSHPLAALQAAPAALPEPAPPQPPPFQPVPADETPPPSIAEQSQPPEPRPLRQVPIPPSGRRRGTKAGLTVEELRQMAAEKRWPRAELAAMVARLFQMPLADSPERLAGQITALSDAQRRQLAEAMEARPAGLLDQVPEPA
jgi:hypothetical protein